MHLHPKWQHEILDILSEIFPKIQFIATTHAPAVIGSVHSRSLIILDDHEILRISDEIYGSDANSILSVAMGAEKRQKKIAAMLKNFYLLLD